MGKTAAERAPLRSRKIKLAKIRVDPDNLNQHNTRSIEAIAASLSRFGQQKNVVVRAADSEGIYTLVAGSGTYAAAESLGWDSLVCHITDLEGDDIIAYAIADNRTAEFSEWDDAALVSELSKLPADLQVCAGFTESELAAVMQDIADDLRKSADQLTYTPKIKSPIYEPTGAKPEVEELVDDGKFRDLVDQVDRANLPAEIANFLRAAATRHLRFNYSRIAEYYAHADEQTQTLMEQSALVIIDFNRAIELGFVQCVERLIVLADEEAEEDQA